MVRLLQQADSLGSTIPWHDHCRAAKKRARVIEFTRGRPKRVQHYRALLRIARNTLDYLQQAAAHYGLARCTWRGLDHFKTYVWSSVVAYNLALFARLRPT